MVAVGIVMPHEACCRAFWREFGVPVVVGRGESAYRAPRWVTARGVPIQPITTEVLRWLAKVWLGW
jgi:hypothetical protein